MAKKLKEETNNVPEAEIEKYYTGHQSIYEASELQRIYVPKQRRQADGTESTIESEREAMRKEAHALQARAAAGVDFIKLQNEAYEAAGITGLRPPVSVGKVTENDLPPSQRSVLAAKAGEVSDVIEDNGYYIFKVISKGVQPLAQVQSEIRTVLAQQKFAEALQKVEQSAKTEINETYLPAGSPTVPPGSAAVYHSAPAGSNDDRIRSSIPSMVSRPTAMSRPLSGKPGAEVPKK
jgi:PPIC-type PPIASE domain